MLDKAEARDLIRDLFEEEALLIGGLVAFYGFDDFVVRHLVKTLEYVRRTFLRRIEEGCPPVEDEPSQYRSTLRPHPAIEEFLKSVRSE